MTAVCLPAVVTAADLFVVVIAENSRINPYFINSLKIMDCYLQKLMHRLLHSK